MARDASATRDDQGARGGSPGEPRPLGRAGGPNQAGGGARRWSLLGASLRVQFTLFTLTVLLVAAALFGWVFWRISGALGAAEAARYTQLAADVGTRLEQLQSSDRERLVGAAFSNELYELVGRGPAPRDSMIHPAFTEGFARQHGDRFIAIYDLTGRRLFFWSDPAAGVVESEAVSNPLFRVLDNREPASGLLPVRSGLLLIGGAPILPADFATSGDPIIGYLVVARPLVPAMLASGLPGGGVLELAGAAPTSQPYQLTLQPAARGDSMEVRFALADIFAQQSIRAALRISRAEFLAVQGRLNLLLLASLGLALLTVAGLWLGLQRLVAEPFRRVAKALQPLALGQTPSPLPPVSATSEWTLLTGAVNRLLSHARASQERFERALGAVRDGYWECELAVREWSFSARFRQLLGYDDAGFLNQRAALEQVLHPEERGSVVARLDESVARAAPLDLELRLRRRDGGYGWYRLQGEVSGAAGGQASRLRGALIDLGPSRAAAERVSRAESERDGLLRTQGGFLVELSARLEGSPSSTALRQLALNLRDLGAVRAGTLPLVPGVFDPHELVQAVVAEAKGAAEARRIELRVAVSPALPSRVRGDATQLRRLLGLLLARALQGAEGGRITVEADRGWAKGAGGAAAAGDSGLLRFAVQDSGKLSPEAQACLARCLEGGGSNGGPPDAGAATLELAVCAGLVRLMSGSAGTQPDEDGGGTRVWVLLPLPSVEGVPPVAASKPPDDERPVEVEWDVPEPEPFSASQATFSTPDTEPEPDLVAEETMLVRLDGDEPSTQNREEAEPVSTALLQELRAAGPGAAKPRALQLVSVFVRDVPLRLLDLRGAVERDERHMVHDIAETLHGMCQLLGAQPMAHYCHLLADMTEIEGAGGAGRLLGRIQKEFARVRSVLDPALRPPPGAAGPLAAPPIDPLTLQQLRARGSSGLGSQLVTLFLIEVPGRVAALERAVEAGEQGTVEALAHDLRGICALLGAQPMAGLCDELARCAGEEPGTAAARLRQLRDEFARVTSVLEGLVGSTPATGPVSP